MGLIQVLLIYCWQANHSFGASNSIRSESQFNHFNGYIFRLKLIANLLLMRWLRALLVGMIYEELWLTFREISDLIVDSFLCVFIFHLINSHESVHTIDKLVGKKFQMI